MMAVPEGQVMLSDRRTQRSWAAVELASYQLATYSVTHCNARRSPANIQAPFPWRPVARRGRLLMGRGFCNVL